MPHTLNTLTKCDCYREQRHRWRSAEKSAKMANQAEKQIIKIKQYSSCTMLHSKDREDLIASLSLSSLNAKITMRPVSTHCRRTCGPFSLRTSCTATDQSNDITSTNNDNKIQEQTTAGFCRYPVDTLGCIFTTNQKTTHTTKYK